jgi:hypothetical protein
MLGNAKVAPGGAALLTNVDGAADADAPTDIGTEAAE